MSDSNTDYEISSNRHSLITKIGDADISKENFINIKTEIKNENSNIIDIPSTSSQSPPIRPISFDRLVSGYAALSYSGQQPDNYTPLEKMKSDSINPFGIYLDLECVNNVEEAIDKWETTLLK